MPARCCHYCATVAVENGSAESASSAPPDRAVNELPVRSRAVVGPRGFFGRCGSRILCGFRRDEIKNGELLRLAALAGCSGFFRRPRRGWRPEAFPRPLVEFRSCCGRCAPYREGRVPDAGARAWVVSAEIPGLARRHPRALPADSGKIESDSKSRSDTRFIAGARLKKSPRSGALRFWIFNPRR